MFHIGPVSFSLITAVTVIVWDRSHLHLRVPDDQTSSWRGGQVWFGGSDGQLCSVFPAGSQPPGGHISTLCLLAEAPPLRVGQRGPHSPFCQTVGEGPDSVLCAPVDKLSRCQTWAGRSPFTRKLQPRTLWRFWSVNIFSASVTIFYLRWFQLHDLLFFYQIYKLISLYESGIISLSNGSGLWKASA